MKNNTYIDLVTANFHFALTTLYIKLQSTTLKTATRNPLPVDLVRPRKYFELSTESYARRISRYISHQVKVRISIASPCHKEHSRQHHRQPVYHLGFTDSNINVSPYVT